MYAGAVCSMLCRNWGGSVVRDGTGAAFAADWADGLDVGTSGGS